MRIISREEFSPRGFIPGRAKMSHGNESEQQQSVV